MPVLVRQPNDRLEILRRDHRARGIRRRIQDDHLGLRRNRRLDHLRGDAEVLLLAADHGNHHAARVLDDVLEGDPERHRQNHLVAVIDQHLDRVEQRQLAAGREDALLGRVVGAKVRRVALHNRPPHLRRSGHRRIAGDVLLDRLDRGVLDVPRRRKMRLARPEVRQIDPFGLQLQGSCGNGHGGRHFDAADPVRKHFGGSGCAHAPSLSDLAREIKPFLVRLGSEATRIYRRFRSTQVVMQR